MYNSCAKPVSSGGLHLLHPSCQHAQQQTVDRDNALQAPRTRMLLAHSSGMCSARLWRTAQHGLFFRVCLQCWHHIYTDAGQASDASLAIPETLAAHPLSTTFGSHGFGVCTFASGPDLRTVARSSPASGLFVFRFGLRPRTQHSEQCKKQSTRGHSLTLLRSLMLCFFRETLTLHIIAYE